MSHAQTRRPTTRFYCVIAGLALLTVLPAGAHGQTAQIDTRTGAATSKQVAIGHYAYGPEFGDADVIGFGQTFRVPSAANALGNFSFFLNNYGASANPSALTLRAYLIAWDASNGRPTGEIVWRSEARSGSTAPNKVGTALSFSAFGFDAGGLSLDAGKHYLAFLTSAADVGAEAEEGSYYNGLQYVYNYSAATGYKGGSYTDGNYVRLAWSGLAPTDELTAADLLQAGITSYDGRRANDMDAAFTADFASAPLPFDMPEPTSAAMLLIGLAGVRRMTRRRGA
jgi:hypothetical protein